MPSLSELVAQIYDRMQHLERKSPHRKLLTYLLQQEVVRVEEPAPPEGVVEDNAFPAVWMAAGGQFDPNLNIRWGSGQWDHLNHLLYAHWSLEEASGTRYDNTVNDLDLTDVKGVGRDAGRVGYAATFSRDSFQYLTRVSSPVLVMGSEQSFSINAWVYLLRTDVRMGLVSKWKTAADQREYVLFLDPTAGGIGQPRFVFKVSSNGINEWTVVGNSLGSPQTGVWYMVTAWHDAVANNIGISVNATYTDIVGWSNGVYAGSSDFNLGYGPEPNDYLDGRLDEVSIYRRALSPAMIRVLWMNGQGRSWPYYT